MMKPVRRSEAFAAFPAFLAFAATMLAASVTFADLKVWTVTDTRHVLRGDAPETSLDVNLAAAHNEWESFQVLLRSDAPIKAVTLEPGDLRGPEGASIGAGTARLYRQHQLKLESGTPRNENFKLDWYPDPLIPARHPVTGEDLGGARFRAMPFDLPANETHGFWVDLYVPPQSTPGEYRGVYRVAVEGEGRVEISVSLTVWDFALPPTPSLVTEFGSPAARMRGYYRERAKAGKEQEPADWAAVEAQCAQLLCEHRCNAVPPPETLRPEQQPDGTFRIPEERVRELRAFVDRYHVNAVPTPHPSNAVKDPEAERDRLPAWLAAFDRAAAELDRPALVFFTYLRDEPNTLEDYRYVQKWGRAVREAKSVVKVLVVEQTWTEPGRGGSDSAWGDLYGAIDIWCPLFSLHRQESAAKRQALGETIWTYTALCQGQPTPWWHIDFPLLNYRVPAWIAWRCRMRGLLYWGGMSYWTETDDPWTQVPVYGTRGARQKDRTPPGYKGEGSLVYPARAVGYDGIVPTIRLKALRDAIEDYDYLSILERLGKSEEAEKIVRPLAESWFVWEKDPAAYQVARAKLAELIVAATTTKGDKGAGPGATRARDPAAGPLRVHPTNPRYFTADGKRAIYLTGSHTWSNLKDMGKTDPPPRFDFDAFLGFLESHGHNFIRLWTWELTRYSYDGTPTYAEPFPWPRAGPDAALDGKPKFDLGKLDRSYFDRLRSRVKAAGERGFYVSVMLFEGHGLHASQEPWCWDGHPFNAKNNSNGIDGDPNHDGRGIETQTLEVPAITAIQEAYVRAAIDAVNDLDNVLYEIANESGNYSTEWQYHMIRFIKEYEKGKPKQHPVGMTFQFARAQAQKGTNAALLASPADWISPNPEGGYREDPPAADGRKVVLNDTDHLWGIGGNTRWVWKSFCRGHNVLFMDPYSRPERQDEKREGTWTDHLAGSVRVDPKWNPLRRSMGATLRLAGRVDLAAMVPHPELAASRYCLASPGSEYVVFIPGGSGAVEVDLSAARGAVAVEWIDPQTGEAKAGEDIEGGSKHSFEPPSEGDAVLYLRASATQR